MILSMPKLKPVQDVKAHDHTCLFFNSESEFFHCAIPFIREGLKNNEKCFIVLDEITRESMFHNFKLVFREGHIPPIEFSNEGRIVILNCKDVYLIDGYFDSERTIRNYNEIMNKTLNDGYTGVRVIAEFSRTIFNNIEINKLVRYEDDVNKLFTNKLSAICSYNKKYFSPSDIKSTCNVHPIEVDSIRTRI